MTFPRCLATLLWEHFADDTKISKKIECLKDTDDLQRDLDSVVSWSLANNMSLNEDKFQLITHKSSSQSQSLAYLPFDLQTPAYTSSAGAFIEASRNIRDLGIDFAEDLNWSNHIRALAANATSMSAWVLNVFSTREPYVMVTLYKSLVRSRLEYCSPLWNPTKLGDIRALENVQRSFTSKIDGLRQDDYWERLSKLKILSLQRRRERFMIFHTWKILNGRAPNDIGLDFDRREDCIKAILRPLPRCSARVQTLFENSFPVCGAKLWNLIPKQCTKLDTFHAFKASLDRFLELIPDRPPMDDYHAPNNNSLLNILFRLR